MKQPHDFDGLPAAGLFGPPRPSRSERRDRREKRARRTGWRKTVAAAVAEATGGSGSKQEAVKEQR